MYPISFFEQRKKPGTLIRKNLWGRRASAFASSLIPPDPLAFFQPHEKAQKKENPAPQERSRGILKGTKRSLSSFQRIGINKGKGNRNPFPLFVFFWFVFCHETENEHRPSCTIGASHPLQTIQTVPQSAFRLTAPFTQGNRIWERNKKERASPLLFLFTETFYFQKQQVHRTGCS